MSDGFLSALTLLAALGSGLIAGVFFAFSAFVMPALARLPPAHGNAAMQSINVVAVTSPFMAALFGTGLTCAGLAVSALRRWGAPGAAWLLGGSLLYLVGCLGVTIVRNLPRNVALAAVAPDSAEGVARWGAYVPGWTAWNTVRAVAALAAAAALTIALVAGRAGPLGEALRPR